MKLTQKTKARFGHLLWPPPGNGTIQRQRQTDTQPTG